MTADPAVQQRKEELVHEVQVTLHGIRQLAGQGVFDPWIDAPTLARAVSTGILDARICAITVCSRADHHAYRHRGACVAIDALSGRALSEQERLDRFCGIDS